MQRLFQNKYARKVILVLILISIPCMIKLTQKIIRSGLPKGAGKSLIIDKVVEYQDLLEKYEVNTTKRLAMFLAQVAHESDSFNTTQEYASGRAYEGRKDLGNTQKGDGTRYKGRGLIQLTGRANYREYGKLMGMDLEGNPQLVLDFPVALEVSLLYWHKKGLNKLADLGDIRRCTKLINGGYNGLADRTAKYNAYTKVLNEV